MPCRFAGRSIYLASSNWKFPGKQVWGTVCCGVSWAQRALSQFAEGLHCPGEPSQSYVGALPCKDSLDSEKRNWCSSRANHRITPNIGRGPQGSLTPALKWMACTWVKLSTLVLLAPGLTTGLIQSLVPRLCHGEKEARSSLRYFIGVGGF